MSDAAADEGTAEGSRLADHRRRAVRMTVLGVIVTVLGLAGLVLTEPVKGSSPMQPRLWAIGALVAGMTVTAAALMTRASPLDTRRPRRPTWLFLAAAGCGLAGVISRVMSGSEELLDYLGPGLLTIYPLALYAYLSWRFKRATGEHGQAPPE